MKNVPGALLTAFALLCAHSVAAEAPRPVAMIAVDPSIVDRGKCGVLSWSVRNATTATIDQGIGPVGMSGSIKICPYDTTSYRITASGEGGTAATDTTALVNTNIPPPAPPPPPPAEENPQEDTEPPEPPPAAPPVADLDVIEEIAVKLPESPPSSQDATPPPAPKKEPRKDELTISLLIEFDTGRSDIKPAYHAEVAKVAEFMKTYPHVKGEIEGHTDDRGGAKYNMRLSQRRAEAVKKFLVEKSGIDGTRLTTKGFGPTKPVSENATKEGRQRNRRIVANFDKVIVEIAEDE